VLEDITTWWPKLKPGGIMAGHDFMTQQEIQALTPAQNFSVYADGSVNMQAVVGAVNDFFLKAQYTSCGHIRGVSMEHLDCQEAYRSISLTENR
jgi:hypothetical protein